MFLVSYNDFKSFHFFIHLCCLIFLVMCSCNFHNKSKKDLYKGWIWFFFSCQRKTTKSALPPTFDKLPLILAGKQKRVSMQFCTFLTFTRQTWCTLRLPHHQTSSVYNFSTSSPQSCKFSFQPNSRWLLPLVYSGGWLDWKPMWWRAARLESDNRNLTQL